MTRESHPPVIAGGGSGVDEHVMSIQGWSSARASAANPRLFAWALAILSVFYLIQTATPLRLDNDAVDYLRMSAAIADGRSLPNVGLPSGYSVFLALLDRAGLGSSFFFVLANCFFLGAGVWATWKIFDGAPARIRQATVLLTLLVTPVVRSVAAPLPDGAFLGTSLLALLAMKTAISAEGRSRMRWFATAFVLAGVATSIRLVGFALLPALLWSCLVALHQPRTDPTPQRRLGLVTIVVFVLLAATIVALARTTIFQYYLLLPRYWYVYGQLASPVTHRITGTFTSVGELMLNVPRSRFHSLTPLFLATGVASGFGLILILRRTARLSAVTIYLLSYVAILVFWPYDSPRLWMPITPLLVALVTSSLARFSSSPSRKRLVTAYAAWFVLTGLVAIAYTTRISLSGDEFKRLYGRNGGMATGNQAANMTPEKRNEFNALVDSVLSRYGNRN